jgi:uncharacterized protein (TIGR03437 family)
MRRILPVSAFLSTFLFTTVVAFGQGTAIRNVTLSGVLPANDDHSTGAINLQIGGDSGLNFFGQQFTRVFVNNNGNLTFGSAYPNFTPNGLAAGVGQPIIAAFLADVDTSAQRSNGTLLVQHQTSATSFAGVGASGLVRYGNATLDSRPAFVANYLNVGYYSSNTDKLNSFQIALIDRSDTGSGNFDIELNYGSIQWETGDADGGVRGLGGISAVAGFSNGLRGTANVFYQLPGSLVNGALLDGGRNALISGTLNSQVPGRYVLPVRNGRVITPDPPRSDLAISGAGSLGTVPLGASIGGSLSAIGGKPPYSWSGGDGAPAGITVFPPTFSGTPTVPGNYSISFAVTDSAGISISGSISFSVFGITGTSLPSGVLFSPYLTSVPVAGGTGPYTFSMSGLPPGLSGNVSGLIQGSVRQAGTFNVAITATDSTGVSVTKTVPLVFTIPPPLVVSSITLPAGMIGQTYSQSLTGASGGAPPYTWSLASGSLPDGLILRPGGTLAGLSSRYGAFTFGVRATDVTGASAVGSASVQITPIPLTILAPSLPIGMARVEFPSQAITAQGGVPPYTFALAAGSSTGGLTIDQNGVISGIPTGAGAFSVNVIATDSAGSTGTVTLNFSVRSTSTDLILSTGSVDFALIAGTQSLPQQQIVNAQSSSSVVIIPWSVTVTPASDWLTVSPVAGNTPSTLNVALTSKALVLPTSDTPYQATVSVACLLPAPCGGNAQTFTVTLSVKNAPPQLNVLSDLISFSATPSATQGASQVLSQQVGLQNAGGGSIGFSSVSCADSWCGVSGVPGSIGTGQTAQLTVAADPSPLTSGYYRTVLRIVASTGTTIVPVTFFIASQPSLSLQPAGEQFQSLVGGVPNGPLQSFLVNVPGSAAVNWSASVLPGAAWLKASPSSGIATGPQPGNVTFTLDPTLIAGLAPQTYYGTIRVTSTGIVNSPQDFQVVLNVAAANAFQRPNPSPAGLLFLTQATSTPPPQTVTISTSSRTSVSVQAAASTSDGATWLSVTPATGSAQPGNPLATQVSVDPSKLAPGVYTGGVSYAYTGLAVRTVSVTLIVSAAPKPTVPEALLSGLSPQADPLPNCSPKQMAAAQTGLVNSFSQPTAWPTPLQILLTNDCGGPVPNGQMVATFSNGDPPLALTLADGRSGLYSATWTPRRTAQQTNISIRAIAPNFAPIATQLSGSVTPNAAPLLTRNSTRHIYNPLAGGALAPGTLVQISGTGLSPKALTAPAGPLPTTLNGTQVIVGGIPAPISSVSDSGVVAELPFGLTPGQQYQVVVSANGALTTPDTVQLVGTAPGLSATPSGFASATHADGTAVTAALPAAPGEELTSQAAGLGLTDTPVADGAISPATPLANASSVPSVTVDGTPAAVSFAGLQPGLVGVYQIRFTVPSGAKNGDLALLISQDGQPGNATTLTVKARP